MKIEIKVPNLGEAEDTEIIEISSNVGDKIQKNDPLIVLESEKAAMEVPSDYEGKLLEIRVKEGEKVKEGMVFAVIETADVKEEVKEEEKVEEILEPKNFKEPEPLKTEKKFLNEGINCGPAVRKISRELGINLSKIIGTGREGLITKDDLKKYISSLGDHSNLSSYPKIEDLKDFGPYELINQSKIRIAGSKNLSKAWISIPHVSHFEEADISKLEIQRTELNKLGSVKITPLAFIIKALAISLQQHQIINSTLLENGKLMLRKYINIGVAIDTNDGLVVPVLKNADNLTLGEIAKEVNTLAEKARSKKLFKNDLLGATFTVSSLGQIGGTNFTPIINPPEVAILGVSRAKKVNQLVDNKNESQIILPLSLSYDHRVINGVDAGKFMQTLKEVLEYKNV